MKIENLCITQYYGKIIVRAYDEKDKPYKIELPNMEKYLMAKINEGDCNIHYYNDKRCLPDIELLS